LDLRWFFAEIKVVSFVTQKHILDHPEGPAASLIRSKVNILSFCPISCWH